MDLFSLPHLSPLPLDNREGKGNPMYPSSQGGFLETNSRSLMEIFGFKGSDPFPLGLARQRTFAGKFCMFMRTKNVDEAT